MLRRLAPSIRKRISWMLRRWFPKRYIQKMLKRIEHEHRKKLKAAPSLSPLERHNLEQSLYSEQSEWYDWLASIEDKELVSKAKKLDVDLDDIPFPEPEPDAYQSRGLWHVSNFGEDVLYPESRKAIRKAVRERMSVYRKEQREVVQFYASIFFGVVGAIIALVSILKK